MRVKRLALLVALVACKPPHERPSERAKPPADAARHYTEADFGEASYLSVETLVAAGREAKGKLALLHLGRGETRENDFTAFACDSHGGHMVYLTIADDQRDAVRALPKNARGACPRVLVRVWSIGPYSSGGHREADGTWVSEESKEQVIEGELLAIGDVKPRPPLPPPAGAQFASFDDIVLSKFKGGEIAELRLKAMKASEYVKHVVMYTCEEDGDVIDFPDEKLDSALANVDGCKTIRLKLRPRGSPGLAGQSIEADLISIGN